MSTDGHPPDVPVSYNSSPTSLRLLELPPELCDLISSSKLQTLAFKSAPPPPPASNDSNSDSHHPLSVSNTPAHAVLCTPTQTYQLRQVQTSNTVLVARPIVAPSASDDPTPLPGISAFATCTSSLELTAMDKSSASSNTKTISAEQWLNYLVPYFEPLHDPDANPEPAKSKKPGSKSDVFADIPFSDAECEDAWRAFCAFDLHSRAVKPSAATLLQLWSLVFQPHNTSQPITPASLRDALLETDIPEPLFAAVLTHLAHHTTPFTDNTAPLQLDRDKTVAWVGQIHYANKVWGLADQNRDPAAMTLDGWRALLPEAWREDVTLDKFADLDYDRFKPLNLRKDSLSPAARGADKAGGKRAGKNRDWHERFKRTRTK